MMRFLSPIPALYRGFLLHPDDEGDPYVFRIGLPLFGSGTCRLAFSQESGVGTTALHLDFGPISFQKQPNITSPRLWITGGLGAGAALAVAVTARAAIQRARGRLHQELVR